jgi:hypothetical protein
MFWWGEKLTQTGTALYRIVCERDGTYGSLSGFDPLLEELINNFKGRPKTLPVLGLGDRRFGDQFSAGSRNFSLYRRVNFLIRSPPNCLLGNTGAFIPRGKATKA